MIFHNHINEIHKKIESVLPPSRWNNQNIVIFGFDVLGKSIADYFIMNAHEKLYIVDNAKFGKKWGKLIIQKPSDTIPKLCNETIVIISPKNKSIYEEVCSFNNISLDCIFDFSDITMDSLENNMPLPVGSKEISLQDSQNEMIKILSFFDEFCLKNDITYFLDYGTLIGAIRHNGFIPWDDDVDVCMPVKDYLKFCNLFLEESNDKFYLDSLYNKKLDYCTVSTLSKIKSKKVFTEFRHFPVRYYSGMGIDLFPLCGVPSDNSMQMEFQNKCLELSDIWKKQIIIPYGTKRFSDKVKNDIFAQMNKMLTKYDYDKYDYITPVCFGEYFYNGNRAMPKEWYKEIQRTRFESLTLNIPSGYDQILKKWYGNYMELPPLNKRQPHQSHKIYRFL